MELDLEILDALKTAMNSEWYAIMAYTQIAHNISGLHSLEYSEMFLDEAKDEMNHLNEFASKISGYNHIVKLPNMDCPVITDIKQALELALKLETDTVENYSKFANLCEQKGNVPLKVMFENICLEEEGHRESLVKKLREIL